MDVIKAAGIYFLSLQVTGCRPPRASLVIPQAPCVQIIPITRVLVQKKRGYTYGEEGKKPLYSKIRRNKLSVNGLLNLTRRLEKKKIVE